MLRLLQPSTPFAPILTSPLPPPSSPRPPASTELGTALSRWPRAGSTACEAGSSLRKRRPPSGTTRLPRSSKPHCRLWLDSLLPLTSSSPTAASPPPLLSSLPLPALAELDIALLHQSPAGSIAHEVLKPPPQLRPLFCSNQLTRTSATFRPILRSSLHRPSFVPISPSLLSFSLRAHPPQP